MGVVHGGAEGCAAACARPGVGSSRQRDQRAVRQRGRAREGEEKCSGRVFARVSKGARAARASRPRGSGKCEAKGLRTTRRGEPPAKRQKGYAVKGAARGSGGGMQRPGGHCTVRTGEHAATASHTGGRGKCAAKGLRTTRMREPTAKGPEGRAAQGPRGEGCDGMQQRSARQGRRTGERGGSVRQGRCARTGRGRPQRRRRGVNIHCKGEK